SNRGLWSARCSGTGTAGAEGGPGKRAGRKASTAPRADPTPLGEVTENAPEAVVAFIGNQRVEHGVPHRVSCRVVGVSEAWFHKWRRRPDEPTEREVRRGRLEERIIHFFTESGGAYGSPRITLDLWAEGWQVSVNTVAEIMAELGPQGRKPPKRRRSPTRQGKRRAAPDLVDRKSGGEGKGAEL